MENEVKDLATDDQKDDPFADLRASKPWLDAIQESEKYFQTYHDKCDNIAKLYADLKELSGTNTERQMQIFWANLEVLKPSIYSRAPVPVVASRFKDRKEINRHAAEILERCLITSFDAEDINETMKMARDDVAMFARGVVWQRYEQDDQDSEKVVYDHLDRKDFFHEPSRKWKEVGWVARRSWLTREQMEGRFGETSEQWTQAEFAERKKEDDYSGEKKACVYELWSKTKNVVVWITPGIDDVLDIRDPFLELENFFPCPKPAYGTVQPGSLIPVPDFLYYKDQVEEINELTARISALAEALRVKGFYAGGNEDIAGAIETAMKQQDNQAILIPVPNFAAMGGAGLKDSIIWLPVDQIAAVIVQLIGLRKQIIDDVYQITGLSDIMRGATDPNETLGAQQLKSQYGSVRVRDRQEELVRISRDMTRIAGEIMAENFQPQTLMAMSQYDGVPSAESIQQQVMQIKQQIMQAAQDPKMVQQAQQNPEQAQQILQQAEGQIKQLESKVTAEQVFEFLRDQRMRPFTLEIETDSTIQPDENANKQRVTEFLGALASALAQLSPMVAQQPETAPFAAEVLKFAVAPFRAGRELEAAIDDFAEQVKETASKPKPNPEAEQMKAEQEAKAADMKLKAQESSAKIKIDQDRLELDRNNANEQRKLERQKIVASAADPEALNRVNQIMEAEALETKLVLDELKAGREQNAQFMQMLGKALMAPKRVVKDENGSPIGVEPVMNETVQ